jgi:hypothetical protein
MFHQNVNNDDKQIEMCSAQKINIFYILIAHQHVLCYWLLCCPINLYRNIHMEIA